MSLNYNICSYFPPCCFNKCLAYLRMKLLLVKQWVSPAACRKLLPRFDTHSRSGIAVIIVVGLILLQGVVIDHPVNLIVDQNSSVWSCVEVLEFSVYQFAKNGYIVHLASCPVHIGCFTGVPVARLTHFICFHGCFIMFETNLMFAHAVLWQQWTQLMQNAAAGGLIAAELSFY
jgi:hypothetical protein